MSQICQITGKRPLTGMKVSHAHNRSKKRSLPNLQSKRFWVASENRHVRLRVSTKGLRIIDRLGIDEALKRARALNPGS